MNLLRRHLFSQCRPRFQPPTPISAGTNFTPALISRRHLFSQCRRRPAVGPAGSRQRLESVDHQHGGCGVQRSDVDPHLIPPGRHLHPDRRAAGSGRRPGPFHVVLELLSGRQGLHVGALTREAVCGGPHPGTGGRRHRENLQSAGEIPGAGDLPRVGDRNPEDGPIALPIARRTGRRGQGQCRVSTQQTSLRVSGGSGGRRRGHRCRWLRRRL